MLQRFEQSREANAEFVHCLGLLLDRRRSQREHRIRGRRARKALDPT